MTFDVLIDVTAVGYNLFTTGRPAFGPTCTEFIYPQCWHFDNGATSKIDDVLNEHGGLLHVLLLAVHLNILFYGQVGDNSG